MPASNEEFFPPPPTREQMAIMHLADQETERYRRLFDMSRAQFVRTAAAMAIGFWAIDRVRPGMFGNYGWAHNTATTDACDLEWDGKQGDGDAAQPARASSSSTCSRTTSTRTASGGSTTRRSTRSSPAIWPQSSAVTGDRPEIGPGGHVRGGGAGEIDPIQNLSRHHYLKELFLDSATSATVLSVVPSSPDTENPLPIARGGRDDRHRQPAGEVQARRSCTRS